MTKSNLQGLYSVRGEKLTLHLHSGQTKAWESERRFIFVIAGTQGGKTSFGPFWLWREIMRQGSGDYLAVTATYDLFKLKMLPEIRFIFEHVLGIAKYHSGERILEIRNPKTGEFDAKRADDPMWARVILRSAAAKGGLESSTAKAAWLDECGQLEFRLEAWEAIRRRLSLHEGRALGTTTPYDLGWLKQNVVDEFQKGNDEFDVIQFASVLNPSFPRSEYEAVQKVLPTWKFRMMYKGEFSRPAGMIYEDFVDDYRENGGHKVRPFKIPSRWRVIMGLDPGAVNLGKIWVAYDSAEDTYYAFRETLGGRKSTQGHTLEIKNDARDLGLHISGVYVGAPSEVQQRLDFQAAGLPNVQRPFVGDVESQIDQVIELLKSRRLFFFDDLTLTLGEISTYSRVLDPYGGPTLAIKNKSMYHLLDALRYAASGTRSTGILFA